MFVVGSGGGGGAVNIATISAGRGQSLGRMVLGICSECLGLNNNTGQKAGHGGLSVFLRQHRQGVVGLATRCTLIRAVSIIICGHTFDPTYRTLGDWKGVGCVLEFGCGDGTDIAG